MSHNPTLIGLIPVVLTMAMAGCTLPDPDGLSPQELCRQAIAAARADFDRKEQEEAIGYRRWFWMWSFYPSQRPQKAPLYIDKTTGFMLMADDGRIGAWISVSPGDTVRDGYDKWACEMDFKTAPRTHVHCPAPRATAVDLTTAQKFAETCALNHAQTVWKGKPGRGKDVTYISCGLFEEHWQKILWRELNDGGMVREGVSYAWPEAAGPKPKYDTPEDGAKVLFNVLAQKGARPVAHRLIEMWTINDAFDAWEARGGGCEGNDNRPVRVEEPPAAPPGATPPDRGGIDVPGGATPGGSGAGAGGDR